MSRAFKLEGKRALVTGANTGIGQSIALGLAEAGAHVVAAGRSSCEETVSQIIAAGGVGSKLTMDLADPSEAVAKLGEAGNLDILVNNAGIIRRSDSFDYTEADWDDVMDINLKVVFFLSQAFAKSRISAGLGGNIINIASLLAFQGGIRVPSYTASKSGIVGLTKILANEWAMKGITVNSVAPGYVVSNNTTDLRNDRDRNKAILDRIPMGRWAEPEDIAGAVTFLAGHSARYVTGITLPVDGGWLGR